MLGVSELARCFGTTAGVSAVPGAVGSGASWAEYAACTSPVLSWSRLYMPKTTLRR